jgi:hypothetical protein
MKVNDSGVTRPWRAAKKLPAKPAKQAPRVKAELDHGRVQAQRAAGDLVFAQRFPGAADRHAQQAVDDEQRQQGQQQATR